MGYPVLIIGESGSGKSTSLRNFGADEIALVNVNGKMLPFRGKFSETCRSDNYDDIKRFMSSTKSKTIAVDDCQYLMANEFMRRCTEKGYEKYTEIGNHFWSLVRFIDSLPDDVIVYFIGHCEIDDNGICRFKTIGKMLNDKITIEGMFTVVLHSIVSEHQYYFSTQSSGDTAKSPIGLFADYLIPNDLKIVDDTIRIYYDMKPAQLCTNCGNPIMPAKNCTVEQIVQGTIDKYGRKLCMTCAGKAKNNVTSAQTVSR